MPLEVADLIWFALLSGVGGGIGSEIGKPIGEMIYRKFIKPHGDKVKSLIDFTNKIKSGDNNV